MPKVGVVMTMASLPTAERAQQQIDAFITAASGPAAAKAVAAIESPACHPHRCGCGSG
jgi:hypothetical protein